uniref:DUF4406 domain-containing protein n=1 Tax=Phocaeicola dorei TaxID=357276 RepID=UPI004026D9C0
MKKSIYQPTDGRQKSKEIIGERENALIALKKLFNEPLEIVESYFFDNEKAQPLECLGKSIQLMAKADIAYFCQGWENARGCRIEHKCAKQYGIAIIEA